MYDLFLALIRLKVMELKLSKKPSLAQMADWLMMIIMVLKKSILRVNFEIKQMNKNKRNL